MDLVMLGLPGAGKGTQAELLAARLESPWISTGDLFRKAVQEKTALGQKAAEYLDRGDLVPDEIVVGMVEERLQQADAREGLVLDGFPRNGPQADKLGESLQAMDREIDHVLFLDVAEGEVVRRLSNRRVCADCAKLQQPVAPGVPSEACSACGGALVQRTDDQESVVRDRLRVYRERTEPLLSYYENKSVLRSVDGTGTLDEVTGRVHDCLGL